MGVPGPRARSIFVTALDLAVIVFASAAIVIVLGGRTRLRLLDVVVSIRGPWNMIAGAAAAAVLRAIAGWGLRPFPAFPPPPLFLEDERLRMQGRMPWDRR